MQHTRIMFDHCVSGGQEGKIFFFDCKFASALLRIFPRFDGSPSKEMFPFLKNILHYFQLLNEPRVIPNRIYFPFNFDRQHWVGICVDFKSLGFQVLDCNLAFRSETLAMKELRPLAQMIPYIVNQITSSGLKHLVFERVKGIPQNSIYVDAAVSVVLLIQYHSMGGVEACNCLKPEWLSGEAQKLAVMFFEEHGEPLGTT